MSKETIKIDEDDKEKLDEIRENYYEYTTLSYPEAVRVLIAEYESSGDDTTQSGGDGESEEDDEFRGEPGPTGDDIPGDDELSAQERIRKVKVDE